MKHIRGRFSYANVMATVAVFVALGGTSYALSLPRNSVGPAQIRSNAVGASELRRGAVKSSELRDRSIRLRDISRSARGALEGQVGPQGPPGPAGVPFFATIDSAGGRVTGNATAAQSAGAAATRVIFPRSVASCVSTATLTSAPVGPNPTPDANAHLTVEQASGGSVIVRTFDAAGIPEQFAFNLIVAC